MMGVLLKADGPLRIYLTRSGFLVWCWFCRSTSLWHRRSDAWQVFHDHDHEAPT